MPFFICITLICLAAIIAVSFCKYQEEKTERIRMESHINLDNVPYTQQNIWKKENKKK